MEILTQDELRALLKGDSTLTKKFHNTERNKILLQKNKFTSPIDIYYETGLSYDLIFEECEFDKSVLFRNRAEIRKGLTFSNCTFGEDVTFTGGNYTDKITFENCTIASASLNFKGGDFQKLRIDRGHFYKLEFFKGKFKEVTLGAFYHEMFIDEIFINCNEIEGKLDFYRVVGLTFDLRGILKNNSSIFISECLIKNFVLCEFTNNGNLRIKRLTYDLRKLHIKFPSDIQAYSERVTKDKNYPYSTFFIQDSVLSSSELFSIDFTEYYKVFMRESSLINIVISNIVWPKEVLHYPIPNLDGINTLKKKSKSDYRVIRENYRQLKYTCSKQGDVIGEQHFHGLEMRAYQSSLDWKKSFWKKFILKLSYATSNYGQSFLLPILWIIGFNGILFWILFISGGTKFNSFDLSSCKNYMSTIAEFLRINNPLHKNDPELNGFPFVIDLLIRVCSSYFIYNIIRATRRFIK